MNEVSLKSLSNEHLIERTKSFAVEERRATAEVLRCLQEVEERRLHLEMAYSSLYEFCREYLQYSEGAAHRRISAMRLLKVLPREVRVKTEEKIESGVLTLTNLSLVQGFLQIEKRELKKEYTEKEKIELITRVENQSKREVEKKLALIQPKIIPQESKKVITDTLTEIRFVADDEFLKKIERIKNLSAHALSQARKEESYLNLFHRMADEYLKRHDPMMKAKQWEEKNKKTA